jgi:hypothetical protein
MQAARLDPLSILLARSTVIILHSMQFVTW